MNKKKLIISGLVLILFFLGGLGIDLIYVNYLGCAVSVIILIILLASKIKIRFPPNTLLYVLFLAFYLVSFIWSENIYASYVFFLLFLSGFLFWIIFYNLRPFLNENSDKLVTRLVLLLGIVFAGLFFGGVHLPYIKQPFFSLIYNFYVTSNHNHLGDFWSVLIIIFTYTFMIDRKKSQLLVVFAGFVILVFSLSRSAVVACFIGLTYLAKMNIIKVNVSSWIKYLGYLLFICFIIYISSFKTLLFSRPYYLQTILGFFRNPLGVGVGNFAYISEPLEDIIPNYTNFSSFAHNLVLELISGMGMFSIFFILWFFLSLKMMVFNKSKNTLLVNAVFLTITANFMFDFTYFIPTMLWIWFATLGLSQSENR